MPVPTDRPAGPLVLVIMDGVGVGCGDEFDTVALAHTPNLDALARDGAYRTLLAHGRAVGLPSDADMGNSEVGHNILGSGRITPQGAQQVAAAFASGRIWASDVWRDVIAAATVGGGTLHLVGLLSDGGVHSHVKHLVALAAEAHRCGVSRLRVHPLFDGRDVPQGSAERYVALVSSQLDALDGLDWAFASGGGRMVTTMDRYEADWSVVDAGWQAHVRGTAHPAASVADGLAWARLDQGERDQYLPAFTVVDAFGAPVGAVRDGDAVILFNFRGDRAIEFARAFDEPDAKFTYFDRGHVPDVVFVGMTCYDGDTHVPRRYLVEPETVQGVLSEVLVAHGLRQWACSETQKFGHVTTFWNGNRSGKFDDALEEYLEIPSDLVPFNERPWMKSAEITDALLAQLRGGRFDFLRVNFASGDMVGHTSDIPATRIAVEAVDLALGRIAAVVAELGGTLVVTADHGNADDMVERDKSGSPLRAADGTPVLRTAHSLNVVPFIVSAPGAARVTRNDLPCAGLANVAATLLGLLGLPVPPGYEPGVLAD